MKDCEGDVSQKYEVTGIGVWVAAKGREHDSPQQALYSIKWCLQNPYHDDWR